MKKNTFLFCIFSLSISLFTSCKKETPTDNPDTNTETRVIYAIKPDGALGWYRHTGYETGTPQWAGDGQFKQVGENWQIIPYAFRADSNIIYAIRPTGELGWYRHNGYQNGTPVWAGDGQFKQVGDGWNLVSKVFSGGGQIIYAIKPNGDLGWYKHLGQPDGTAVWANNGQFTKISEGWQDYVEVFSAGNGIIYAIKANGDLGWFKHLGYADGTDSWAGNGQFLRVGENWNLISHAFSGGGQIIYGIKPTGELGWYKHLGQQDGTSSWANNGQFAQVGENWQIFVNSF